MKSNKKKVLKVLAAVIAFTLIGFILFVANSFTGNPVSAMIAENKIKQYVQENYSFLDLEVENPHYNFKFGNYEALAKSKTSKDTKFYIYYRDGKVYGDDYEFAVLEKNNTIERLANEYSNLAKRLLTKEITYEINSVRVLYDYETVPLSALQLDMEFDRTLPLQASVFIEVNNANTLKEVAEILIQAHQTYINNDCHFKQYSIDAKTEDGMIVVFGVTPDHIESGDLISMLEKAKEQSEYEGISVIVHD